ncbi:hypothetical protein CfE428DRAFT_5544 [Chthoniobacter flavus Ellin428]|uniref:Uncharacterized protein n=1 Tax=Chthoniobacter flavus Ellin428 TaxID=497964 RepID=B4D9F4_9BACT|nr:hypothetical protein [Chthoniobacter flavus]EDY16915.1 hypothetical protein CfE428DRAFT_5544 [Chthoniobacter flavus Ellin428]TCO87796.1 hypothetical protein EV701_12095 [Chthoniobacter flavus]
MPPPRLDQRDPSHPKYGKPGVSYPYGDLRFPRIVEAWNARKTDSRRERAFLSAHPDKLSYPNALLISQSTDKGSDDDQNFTAVYETLPGPIFVDIRSYRETGIPMLTARRQVAANGSYTAGEFQPAPVHVSSIADNGDGTCTVTLSAAHDLPPKCWVVFAGTNSAPAIDGNQMIVSVPSETQIVVSANLTGAGTAAGTMTAINRIVRELQPVPSNASILIKLDTMVGVPSVSDVAMRNVQSVVNSGNGTATVTLDAAHGLSVGDWVMLSGTKSAPKVDGPRKILSIPLSTKIVVEVIMDAIATITSGGVGGTMTPMGALATYNEDFHCWKDYDFPDFLKGIQFYNDGGSTAGFNGYNYSTSWGGAVGLPMQDGYHGPCRARRLRCFFVGPPPDSFESNLAPTFVMPSSGTFVIQGGSSSRIFTPDLVNSTISSSVNFRTGRIPHCLTGTSATGALSPSKLDGSGGITALGGLIGGGSILGFSGAIVDLPASIPTQFTQGDIITLMGQPSKYDAGGLWEVVVFLISVPYTSGSAPS